MCVSTHTEISTLPIPFNLIQIYVDGLLLLAYIFSQWYYHDIDITPSKQVLIQYENYQEIFAKQMNTSFIKT